MNVLHTISFLKCAEGVKTAIAVSEIPKRPSVPLYALALQDVRETSRCVRTSKRVSPSIWFNVVLRGVCRLYRLERMWIRYRHV